MLSLVRLIGSIVSPVLIAKGIGNEAIVTAMVGTAGLVTVIVCSLVSNRGQGIEMLWGLIRQALGGVAGIVVYFGWLPLDAANEILGAILVFIVAKSSIENNTPEAIAEKKEEAQ